MATYLAVGPPDNLEIGINQNVWGLPSTAETWWRRLVAGDRVVLYATAPIKGIVGYAEVESTMRDASLLWPQEKQRGRCQWHLRISRRNIRVVPAAQWASRCYGIKRNGLFLRRSFQLLNWDRAAEFVKGINAVLNES